MHVKLFLYCFELCLSEEALFNCEGIKVNFAYIINLWSLEVTSETCSTQRRVNCFKSDRCRVLQRTERQEDLKINVVNYAQKGCAKKFTRISN
jgi:hypothetical protein